MHLWTNDKKYKHIALRAGEAIPSDRDSAINLACSELCTFSCDNAFLVPVSVIVLNRSSYTRCLHSQLDNAKFNESWNLTCQNSGICSR